MIDLIKEVLSHFSLFFFHHPDASDDDRSSLEQMPADPLNGPNSLIELDMSSASERGGRMRNEDSRNFACDVACVSDGIGGAPYGDVLAQICTRAFPDEWKAANGCGAERMVSAIIEVDNLASRISAYLEGGSGATLVAAARVPGDELVLGSVGDSAAFMLTPDGALKAYFGPAGRISQESNAMNVALGYHLLSSEAGRAIPGAIDLAVVPIPAGTKVLLCTDGVWSQLSEERIAELLRTCDDPYEAAYRIVREAVGARGESSDNATAIVIVARDCTATACGNEPFDPLDSSLIERAPRT